MTREVLVEKLHPNRIHTSPKFTAMLAFFLDEHWTNPKIVEMAITSDDILLVGTTDDPLLNDIEGNGLDLWTNLTGIAAAAGLTIPERDELMQLARSKVKDWSA